MTATNHALTGAVVALAIKKPELAIPLAFLSHFAVDMIPHFDSGPTPRFAKRVIAADITLAGVITVMLTIFLNSPVAAWILFASMVAAMSPDLVWGWRYYKLKDFKKIISEPMSLFSRYHQKIQWSETRLGIIVEIIWILLTSWLIEILAHR